MTGSSRQAAAGLTGSPAASWQRCTRLSKVDLRTMCSAGISFCSTLSAGSCWSCWAKRGHQYKVLEVFAMCVAAENSNSSLVSHTYLHAGLLGGSGGDLGVVVRLRGLHWVSHHRGCDRCWWSVVIRDLWTEKSNTTSLWGGGYDATLLRVQMRAEELHTLLTEYRT